MWFSCQTNCEEIGFGLFVITIDVIHLALQRPDLYSAKTSVSFDFHRKNAFPIHFLKNISGQKRVTQTNPKKVAQTNSKRGAMTFFNVPLS